MRLGTLLFILSASSALALATPLKRDVLAIPNSFTTLEKKATAGTRVTTAFSPTGDDEESDPGSDSAIPKLCLKLHDESAQTVYEGPLQDFQPPSTVSEPFERRDFSVSGKFRLRLTNARVAPQGGQLRQLIWDYLRFTAGFLMSTRAL
ncbi:hypothetical protein PM082_022676 [Marasmius tenuissimus]|nr:hypothetical protein PM082_022676 [Marasmius tenuissimus]